MTFIEVSDDVNNESINEGTRIFKELVKKYDFESRDGLDIILNSLCLALTLHFNNFCKKGSELEASKIVQETIYRNLMKCRSTES
jgi:hypothetical protein